MDAVQTLDILRDLELSGEVPQERMNKLKELQKEATDKFDKINGKMERIVAERIKTIYDQTEGAIVVAVGEEHIRKGFDIDESLEKLSIPKEQIAIIAVKPADELPPKKMQIGGQYGATATIFVEDKENGRSMAQLGGTIVCERNVIDKDKLKKIEDLQFKGRPDVGQPQFIGLDIVMDKKDSILGSINLYDIAFPGMEKPLAQKARIVYGRFFGNDNEVSVDIDISDLPMKQPGEKLTDDEKKKWTERLQKGIDELRKKIEAKEKAQEKEKPAECGEEDKSAQLNPGLTPAVPVEKLHLQRNQ